MQDDKHSAMGVRAIALSDSYGTMFANPASLAFNSGSLYASMWVEDSGYVKEPFSTLALSFCGKRMGFTFEQTTEFEKREDGAYNSMKYTYLQMDWAYNWKRVALGLRLKAQTAMKRSSIELSAGKEIADLFVQTCFARYENNPNSTKVEAALGAMLDLDWFAFGVVSDQFAEASNEGNLSFSGKDLYENLCFGCSFSSPTFNQRSQLNLFKGITSLELIHPFKEECAIQGGVDVRMQLLPDFQLDFMAGWQQPFSQGEFFCLDWREGTQSAGVSLTLQEWELGVHVQVPASVYDGDGDLGDVHGVFTLSYNR